MGRWVGGWVGGWVGRTMSLDCSTVMGLPFVQTTKASRRASFPSFISRFKPNLNEKVGGWVGGWVGG